MARFTTEVTSSRAAEDVFDYLADMRNASSWDPGVSGATLAKTGEDGAISEGAAFDVTLRLAGRPKHVEYRVASYDRPHRVVLEAKDSAFRSTDTVSVESLPDGTARTTYDAVLEPVGLWRVSAPLMALAFGRIGRRAAEGLARELGR